MLSLATRWAPPETLAIDCQAPPEPVRRKTSYLVIGGPLGSVAGQVTLTWALDALGVGVRGDNVGAGTAAGVPNDWALTSGPKGPQPASLLAWTRTLYASSLTSPLMTLVSPGAGTSACPVAPALPPMLTHWTRYLRTLLPSFGGSLQRTVSLRSPGVMSLIAVALGLVSGRTVLLRGLMSDQPTGFLLRTVKA